MSQEQAEALVEELMDRGAVMELDQAALAFEGMASARPDLAAGLLHAAETLKKRAAHLCAQHPGKDLRK
jgi:hypothetical protein